MRYLRRVTVDRPELQVIVSTHSPEMMTACRPRDIVVLRLRTLLAKAPKDDVAYRDLRERYRAMANLLGYEGHMAWAEAMP